MRSAFAPWNPAYMMSAHIQRSFSCLRHSNRALVRKDGIGMTTGADDDPASIAGGLGARCAPSREREGQSRLAELCKREACSRLAELCKREACSRLAELCKREACSRLASKQQRKQPIWYHCSKPTRQI
jgi:hypothetical protein